MSHIHGNHVLAVAKIHRGVIPDIADPIPAGHEGGGVGPGGQLFAAADNPNHLVLIPHFLPEGGDFLVVNAALSQKYPGAAGEIGHTLFHLFQTFDVRIGQVYLFFSQGDHLSADLLFPGDFHLGKGIPQSDQALCAGLRQHQMDAFQLRQ